MDCTPLKAMTLLRLRQYQKSDKRTTDNHLLSGTLGVLVRTLSPVSLDITVIPCGTLSLLTRLTKPIKSVSSLNIPLHLLPTPSLTGIREQTEIVKAWISEPDSWIQILTDDSNQLYDFSQVTQFLCGQFPCLQNGKNTDTFNTLFICTSNRLIHYL